jgi:hypothetical protein
VNGALLRTHAGRPQALNPARYTCYRAAGPIVVDGKLDEPSWLAAPRSSPFVDIVTGEAAWFDSRVAMLWDDEHLYFGFTVEETDVWGTLTFSGSPSPSNSRRASTSRRERPNLGYCGRYVSQIAMSLPGSRNGSGFRSTA